MSDPDALRSYLRIPRTYKWTTLPTPIPSSDWNSQFDTPVYLTWQCPIMALLIDHSTPTVPTRVSELTAPHPIYFHAPLFLQPTIFHVYDPNPYHWGDIMKSGGNNFIGIWKRINLWMDNTGVGFTWVTGSQWWPYLRYAIWLDRVGIYAAVVGMNSSTVLKDEYWTGKGDREMQGRSSIEKAKWWVVREKIWAQDWLCTSWIITSSFTLLMFNGFLHTHPNSAIDFIMTHTAFRLIHPSLIKSSDQSHLSIYIYFFPGE